MKNQMVLSSVFVVVAALAACGKPEIRSKTMDAPTPPAPSTASNPKVAEVENKAGDAAQKLAAKSNPAAAAEADIAAARKQAALDELAELMKREGADPQQIADARAKVTDAGGTPLAEPRETDDAAKAALIEHAAHRAFAIAMVEPVMRANFQVFLARHEILRLKNTAEVEKKELTAEQKTWLQKIRLEYGLSDDKGGFDALLERVDGVNLTFLAAPLAIRSNWTVDAEVQTEKITQRMQEMNISPSPEKIAFRSARLAVKIGNQEESLSLMKAFLGYSEDSKNPTAEKVLETVTEILKHISDPAYQAEIERVRTLLIEEYKKNEAAKSAPLDTAKK